MSSCSEKLLGGRTFIIKEQTLQIQLSLHFLAAFLSATSRPSWAFRLLVSKHLVSFQSHVGLSHFPPRATEGNYSRRCAREGD